MNPSNDQSLPAAPARSPRIVRGRPAPLVLEQRLVFDGDATTGGDHGAGPLADLATAALAGGMTSASLGELSAMPAAVDGSSTVRNAPSVDATPPGPVAAASINPPPPEVVLRNGALDTAARPDAVDPKVGGGPDAAGDETQFVTAPTIDIQGGMLNFGNGTLVSGSNLAVGAVYKYTNVITKGGTQIDAFVTVSNIVNATIGNMDVVAPNGGLPFMLTNPDGTTTAISDNALFAPTVSTSAPNGRVDFTITFKDTAGNALTLLDFYNNSLDIDGPEFVEYGGFQRYEMASPTDLTAAAGTGDQIRFTGSQDYSGLILNHVGRVQTRFDSVTSLTISMGTTTAAPAARQFGAVFAFHKFTTSVVVSAPTVNSFVTNDNTPALTGTIGNTPLGGAEAFSVTVNGATYARADPAMSFAGLNWTLAVPSILPDNTYNVRALRGGVLPDQTSGELVIDTTNPVTASIVVADTALKVGETSLVTIEFSEPISGFTNADLTVANGTIGAVSSSDGGRVWTTTFTPTAGIENALNLITLNNAGVADLAGNAGIGITNSNNYAIDTARPTATIVVADTSLAIGETSLVTITFTEAVGGFTNADLIVANGTLSAVSSSNGGITWTATFTPAAGIQDTSNVIHLANADVTDLAGNAGAGTADSNNYAIDTLRPTATITVADTALRLGETSLVTIAFSEAVTGFTNADLTIANGTLTAVVSADGGMTWTATFTPTATLEDTSNVITLANTGVADLAGNPGSGTTDSNNYAIDTLRPTATITVADTALRLGETSLVTIAFSEAVTGFTNADLTIANGTLTAVSSANGGITWTATFTPTATLEDTSNVIALANTGVADLAGNAGAGTTDSNNYGIDTLRPTATITVADTALRAGETSLVTIAFLEAVTGFTNADLTIVNGTLTAVGSADGGITWTATFTPTATLEDTSNVITLTNTGVADLAGNAGAGTTDSNNYAIDTLRPTATITVADTALRLGETSLVTIAFSEAVTGFTNADLTIANGALTAVSSANGGITWTATFTPTATLEDTSNVITLANTGVADLAGNAGAGTTDSNNYAIDTLRPTAAITVADTALRLGETSLVTIVFSEAITGFSNVDLTIVNGTLTAVGSADGGITWTATFTPAGSLEDTSNLITLAITGVADLAGNAGTGTTDSNNYAIDTRPPTVAITSSAAGVKAGETVTLTFTFSEAPAGFTVEDIAVESGTLSAFAATTDPKIYTATYTPAANTEDAAMNVTVAASYTDLAGNTGSGAGASFSVDSRLPTITGPSGGAGSAVSAVTINEQSTAVATFSASENVTWSIEGGADAAKFSINGSGVLVFQSPPDFETPLDLGDTAGNNTYIVAIKATDTQGNASTQIITVTVADVDENAPIITGPSGGAGTATSAITINENTTTVTTFAANEAAVWTVSGGADAERFSINAAGVLTFNLAPDFETPLDLGSTAGNNTYVVVIQAADALNNRSIQTLTVTIADVDEIAPAITGPSGGPAAVASGISIVENRAIVATLSANEPVVWSIVGGADAGKFSINSSGALVFGAAPDYETPLDLGDTPGNNTYVVAVKAMDPTGNFSVQTVTVTIVDVDEIAPLITGPSGVAGAPASSVSINENSTGVTTFVASEPVTWALIGGEDQSHFSLNPATGALVFNTAPNFEIPTDGVTSGRNTYGIVVRATDASGLVSTQTVTVNVINVNEPPVASLIPGGTARIGSPLPPITVPAFSDVDSSSISYTARLADGNPLPGWLNFDPARLVFSGTPPVGTATGSLVVRVTGSDGSLTDNAMFAIVVALPNAPVAVADAAAATEASGIANAVAGTNPAGNVLGNDEGVALRVTTAGGLAIVSGARLTLPGRYGTLTLGSDGNYVYSVDNRDPTVEALNVGGVLSESFNYTLTDAANQTSTASLVITINGANDAPVASAAVGGPATIGLPMTPVAVRGFTDVDNAILSYTATRSDGSALPPWLTFDPDTRTFSGTPPFGTLPGALDLVVFGSAGGATNRTAVSIVITNPAGPVALADEDSATESSGVNNAIPGNNPSGNVMANDTGTSPLRVTGVTGNGAPAAIGAGGAATIRGNYGSLTLGSDGRYSYSLDNAHPAVEALNIGRTLSDTFNYTLVDQANQGSGAILTITINGADDASVASTVPAVTGTIGAPLPPLVVPAFSDVDSAAITYSATLSNGAPLPAWLVFDPATRAFSGTPPFGTPPGPLNIAAIGAAGGSAVNTAVTLVLMNPAIPVAADDAAAASEASGVGNTISGDDPSGTVLANDNGSSALRVTTVQSGPGAILVGANGAVISGRFGTLSIEPSGAYHYVVDNTNIAVEALNAGDAVVDSFVYQTTDQAGQSATASLRITIQGRTDIPPPFVPPPDFAPSSDPGVATPVLLPPGNNGPGIGQSEIEVGFRPPPVTWSGLPTRVEELRLDFGRIEGDLTAPEAGFRIVVIPSESSNLMIYRGVPDQFSEANAAINFTVPTDAFAHTRAGAQVMLNATLTNGSPLPDWLQFDKATGTFKGIPPKDFVGEVRIKVIAIDGQGMQAEAVFRFNVGKLAPTTMQPRFSEQIRRVAYLSPPMRGFDLAVR